MGLAEARLELAASNDPARGLYERLGFMVVGRRKRYYPDGDDALLLSRMISSGRSAPPQ
jgi:ribosomal-protein-alanine N-acetyltransferase